MTLTIYGASDDLIEVEGDISEEFNVWGMDDIFVAASTGLLARAEYDSDGVWRFRIYVTGLGLVQHKEVSVDDLDEYSDVIDVTEATVAWVLVGPHLARAKRGHS